MEVINSIDYCKQILWKFNPDEYCCAPQNSSEIIKHTLCLEFIAIFLPDSSSKSNAKPHFYATTFYSAFYYCILLIPFLLCMLVQMNYTESRVPNDQILLKLELMKFGRLLSLFTHTLSYSGRILDGVSLFCRLEKIVLLAILS